MSQFYARYVPTKPAASPPQTSPESVAGHKRKAERQISKKPKKSKVHHEDVTEKPQVIKESLKADSQPNGGEKVPKISKAKKSKLKQKEDQDSQNVDNDTPEAQNIPAAYKAIKKRINSEPKPEGIPVATEGGDPAPSMRSQDGDDEPPQLDQGEQSKTNSSLFANETKHGLEPFPQPPAAAARSTDIAYSVLPPWMQTPVLVDETAATRFDSYKLDDKILNNLNDKSISLPIQNTVLPLLLDKDVWSRPDLCVSAVTGSGKTLAYVLPILQSLSKRTTIRLRAVIVVPTRALVKQVSQECEGCSRGMGLRIATAEGGRTLEEEQRALVEKFDVYDPDEYKEQQQAPIDWTKFSLRKAIRSALNQDRKLAPNYVIAYASKADILIATPGRLIEHLQATEGFNLDDVEWFIADEADRLLNESYHEWLETVLSALKSRAASREADIVLAKQRLISPQRRVTKVLLSATMTSDISQLLQMDLVQPKLVILKTATKSDLVEDQIQHVPEQAFGQFNLPPSLEEIVIPLKDAEYKPLYLLQILRQSVLTAENKQRQAHGASPVDRKHRIGEDSDTSSSGSDTDSSDDSASVSAASSADSEQGSSSSDDSLSNSKTSSSSDIEQSFSKRANTTNMLTRTKELTQPRHSRALIFTRSTESASRLARLLSLLDPKLTSQIASFSSSSNTTTTNSTSNSKIKTIANTKPARTNKKILAAFASGAIRVLISTDLGGRGLDITGLDYVINYDVPASVETYVHRVGRTARAGKRGTAFTLLEHRQGKWFWDTIGGKRKDGSKAVIGRSQKLKARKTEIDPAQKEAYEQALQKLGEDVKNG